MANQNSTPAERARAKTMMRESMLRILASEGKIVTENLSAADRFLVGSTPRELAKDQMRKQLSKMGIKS